MPVNQYSVLIGDPQPGGLDDARTPHYLINVNAAGTQYQVAINVKSESGAPQVLYNIQNNFQPPDPSLLTALSQGMNPLTVQGNPAIDFIRSRSDGHPIVTQQEMQLLPLPSEQSGGNLHNAVIQLLNQATADPNGVLYAFGSQYTDGTGIHDIHMNQGNPESDHGGDNSIWTDGAILFQLPSSNTWTAIFIAFQDQSWQTDDNGNPVS